jgi:hypothetical protein
MRCEVRASGKAVRHAELGTICSFNMADVPRAPWGKTRERRRVDRRGFIYTRVEAVEPSLGIGLMVAEENGDFETKEFLWPRRGNGNIRVAPARK